MAPHVDTEQLIRLVEQHPELWDTRSDGYHDRLAIECAWFAVAEQLYPRPGWATYSPAKQAKFVDLVKRRWHSARDQFRWEFNPLPSTTDASKKRQYVYYHNLAFLRPILELNPTYDNLVIQMICPPQTDHWHVLQPRRPNPQRTPLHQHSLNRCLMSVKPPLMLLREAHNNLVKQHHKQQPQHHRQHQPQQHRQDQQPMSLAILPTLPEIDETGDMKTHECCLS
ncbi:uncharacterized protein [Dendrobates tinctorius]|uniref:uncharacterized protein n=1 Tax=Dendrobates tinctorius TaxID=92724 RepID=UPI003CC991FE